jgi:hypothetical protein
VTQPPEGERLWTARETAAYLGITKRQLYSLRDVLPRIMINERVVRYEPEIVRDFKRLSMDGRLLADPHAGR